LTTRSGQANLKTLPNSHHHQQDAHCKIVITERPEDQLVLAGKRRAIGKKGKDPTMGANAPSSKYNILLRWSVAERR
jgi:hypothetical protein